MTLIAVIAVALIAYSALVIARLVMAPRARAAARIAQIDAYGFTDGGGVVPDMERRSIIEALGGALASRLSREQVATIRSRLLGAGMYETSVDRFLGYRALSVVLTPAFTLYLALGAHLSAPLAVCFMGLGIVTGWILPQAYIARRARIRLDEIDGGMPELVDLLVVGVESGMGFSGAMRVASQRVDGPLGDELQLMLREQSLGATLSDALRHLLDRCDTPATRSFARTIIQGERLGVSIAQMMRSLAEEMRKRRKARAEELAHKAPVKILFPLVFLIFPAIFIIVLGPAVIRIVGGLGGV